MQTTSLDFHPIRRKLSHYLPFVTYTFIFLLVFANRIMIVGVVVVVVEVEFVAVAAAVIIVAFRLRFYLGWFSTIHITMATNAPYVGVYSDVMNRKMRFFFVF